MKKRILACIISLLLLSTIFIPTVLAAPPGPHEYYDVEQTMWYGKVKIKETYLDGTYTGRVYRYMVIGIYHQNADLIIGDGEMILYGADIFLWEQVIDPFQSWPEPDVWLDSDGLIGDNHLKTRLVLGGCCGYEESSIGVFYVTGRLYTKRDKETLTYYKGKISYVTSGFMGLPPHTEILGNFRLKYGVLPPD
jgi:hypothetical protein